SLEKLVGTSLMVSLAVIVLDVFVDEATKMTLPQWNYSTEARHGPGASESNLSKAGHKVRLRWHARHDLLSLGVRRPISPVSWMHLGGDPVHV
ncbi:MAG: hypothetical protein V3T48_11645, partial [Vicinamibacterales bacterium]